MSTGDLAEVQVLIDDSDTGSTYEMTFGMKALDNTTTRSDLAGSFKTALVKNTSGGLLFQMSTRCSCSEVDVVDVVPGTGATVFSGFSSVAGIEASDELPPQSAAVISWRTATKGRSFRGRSYYPGLCEFHQANGTLTNTCHTNLVTIVTQMLAVYGPGGSDTHWQFVVISRRHLGAPRTPPIGTAVVSGLVDTIVRSQRRRQVGVGR